MNRERIIVLAVLCATSVAMLATNSWFTFFDDEITIIQEASKPLAQTVQSFLEGRGQHRHPPLYDLLLSGWLGVTGGRLWALRVPAVLLYVLGLWFLSLTAEKLAGPKAALWTVLIGALWPYGFQFGRVAGWYSCAFCAVAGVTCAYVFFRAQQNWMRWAFLVVSALVLLYTNYFGWAFLGLLALEYWWKFRRVSTRHVHGLGATLAVLIAGFLPLWNSFLLLLWRDESAGYLKSQFSMKSTVLFSAFNLYSTYVSESVAPWFWMLSLPALVAIGVSLFAMAFRSPAAARVLLAGFLVIFTAMSVTGIVNTKRLLLVAPWLLLAMAISLAAPAPMRRTHNVALAVVAAIGWFGMFARNYYSAPRLVEPWAAVAEDAAKSVQAGGVVVSNHPSFFFYLTYDLDRLNGERDPIFKGVYPERRSNPQIFAPDQWLRAGHALAPKLLFVNGVSDPGYWQPSAESERWLDSNCELRGIRRQMPDSGAALKEKFFPGRGQLAWRIEVREYACGSIVRAPGQLHRISTNASN